MSWLLNLPGLSPPLSLIFEIYIIYSFLLILIFVSLNYIITKDQKQNYCHQAADNNLSMIIEAALLTER